MKSYRQQIAKVVKICWQSSLSIFFGSVLALIILDLIAFLLLFIVSAGLVALFANWQLVWDFFKGPTHVIIYFG